MAFFFELQTTEGLEFSDIPASLKGLTFLQDAAKVCKCSLGMAGFCSCTNTC